MLKEVVKKQKISQSHEQSTKDPSVKKPTKKAQENALSKIDLTGNSLTMAMHSGLGIASPFTREIFLREQLPIVGMRFQGGSLDLLREIQPGSRITFMREPENHYDEKAIMALDGQGRKLGYISRYENEVLSALMDAGKTLYGIVSHIPRSTDIRTSGPPTVLYVDLYMREFAAPDDPSQIPLQGYRGSYVVMDLELTEEAENAKIQSVFAIRVINGEERGILSEEIADDDYEKLIQNLWEAAGYLPVVLCDSSGRQQEALENGWGIYAGKPFSNQVIEICEMGRNHLNMAMDPSLEGMVQRLGIEAEGDTPSELRCRQIWQIYCRFDRSKLEKSPDPVTEILTKKKYKTGLDIPVSELKMTQQLREALVEHDIDILWEVSVMERNEAKELLGAGSISELEELLQEAGSGFKPQDCTDSLYGYPKSIHKIAEEKGESWRCFLFFALYEFRYLQLARVRKLETGFWSHKKAAFPVTETTVLAPFLNNEIEFIKIWFHNYERNINRLNEASESEDDQDCIVNTEAAIDVLIRQYKELMAFKRRFQYVDSIESFKGLIEDIANLGEQLCIGCVDGLYQKSVKAEKVLNDYIDGGSIGEAPELDLKLNYTVDMGGINQKIDALIS